MKAWDILKQSRKQIDNKFWQIFLFIYHLKGRFIKDPLDQNTLKITDLQYEDGGTYTCVARTEVDEVRADSTLVVQDRPNRPRIDNVVCTSGSSQNGIQPRVRLDFSNGGENNAKILYFKIQYNTSFTPNEWINVKVTAQREISASVENKTDDEITRLTLVRKFESKFCFFSTQHDRSKRSYLWIL